MALGNYVEISTTVEDDEQALAFYEALGFKHCGYRVVTDGSININLAPPGVESPMLRYAGCDMESAAVLDIGLQHLERGVASFVTPDGLRIMLSPHASRVAMPEGTPIQRTPISRCGKFGEYALPVKEREVSIAYWEQLGFEALYRAEEPYPWSILTDGLIVLGLHQSSDMKQPHITYFAPDMAERIKAFQAEGIPIVPMAPEGQEAVNAMLTGPGGERFFLFEGQI